MAAVAARVPPAMVAATGWFWAVLMMVLLRPIWREVEDCLALLMGVVKADAV